MFLTSVEVDNFRNLNGFTARFHPGLNLIVGRNGTGKSNLFRAIRLALGPAASYGDMAWLVPDDRHQVGPEPTTKPIRISLTFAGLSEPERVMYFDILEYDSDSPERSLARIHFEATWDAGRERFLPRRWGGPLQGDRTEVPPEVLQSIPLTFLPALRDAESALSPGRASRLARLLDYASREEPGVDHETRVVEIFKKANDALATSELVRTVEGRLADNTEAMAGADFVAPSIAASPPRFGRILKSLRVLLPDNPVQELSAAGLGYNNLLFIATVLAQLRDSPEGDTPLLLIEEPEAHLHPQLVSRLGRFLAGHLGEGRPPQTLVASHSPLLASQVKPSQTSVFFHSSQSGSARCSSLRSIELTDVEERKLFRMLDITRATMYFARGLILVEGLSEELLVPPLARLLDVDLSSEQVSVLPAYGVGFDTLANVLGPKGLDVRVAILTDADPEVNRHNGWRSDAPEVDGAGNFPRSDRTENLISKFQEHPSVRVFSSELTLEYDLAAPTKANAQLMAEVWRDQYPQSPVVTPDLVNATGSSQEAALTVWRGICRSETSGSKAEFAHSLAERLSDTTTEDFEVPAYIRQAIEWVCPSPEATTP